MMPMAKSDTALVQLATCMAVVDFQIHLYQVFNTMHPGDLETQQNLPRLSRLLSIQHVVRSRIIPHFTPEQTQVLADMYLLLRAQVFHSFTISENLNQLQVLGQALNDADQSCEPLNISTEQ